MSQRTTYFSLERGWLMSLWLPKDVFTESSFSDLNNEEKIK